MRSTAQPARALNAGVDYAPGRIAQSDAACFLVRMSSSIRVPGFWKRPAGLLLLACLCWPLPALFTLVGLISELISPRLYALDLLMGILTAALMPALAILAMRRVAPGSSGWAVAVGWLVLLVWLGSVLFLCWIIWRIAHLA